MNTQKLIIEFEADEKKISQLLAELEKRAEKGEFEINAVTLRKK